MARWCALHRVESPEELKAFDLEGYKFVPKESTATVYVYGRVKPPPAAASSVPKSKKSTKGAVAEAETRASQKATASVVAEKSDSSPAALAGRPRKRSAASQATAVKMEDGDHGGRLSARATKRRAAKPSPK